VALWWGRDVLARWRWIVGRVVSRVRGVGVVAMIDRGRRRRREVVALWEVARVVGVGGVYRRAMAGAVATGAISRVVFAASFSLLVSLFSITPLCSLVGSQSGNAGNSGRLGYGPGTALASTTALASAAASATVRRGRRVAAASPATRGTRSATGPAGRTIRVDWVNPILHQRWIAP
jgi:hypothetical protein